jgi:hypothetical protein
MPRDTSSPPRLTISVCLLSGILAIFLGAQTAYLISDHEALQKDHDLQDKPLAQIDKVKTQLGVLANGTFALAKKGDKNAQEIVQDLKKSGIDFADQSPAEAGEATAPAVK